MFPMNNKPTAASGGGEFTTSALLAVPVLAHNEPNEPEFYSMPSVGQTCNGLRRGALYCLWRDGEIETISVRRKGRARGRRLIVGDSLRKYLRRLREEQNPFGVKEGAK